MKSLFTIIFLAFAVTAWAIPPSPPVDVDGSISTHSADTSAHPGYVKIEKTITNPNDADVWYIGHNPINGAWTISEVRASALGGTSAIITVQECDADCANCAAVMSALTVTTGTTVTGTLTDTSIADNACIAIDVGVVTGAVTQTVVTIK